MSCEDCEAVAEMGGVYWMRMGKASIGIVACEQHFQEARNRILDDGDS